MINDISQANLYVEQVTVLTSPYKIVDATVSLLLRFGGFYRNTHTKIRPCNIIGNAGSCSCKGYIRDSIITGFDVLSQGSPV